MPREKGLSFSVRYVTDPAADSVHHSGPLRDVKFQTVRGSTNKALFLSNVLSSFTGNKFLFGFLMLVEPILATNVVRIAPSNEQLNSIYNI